MAGNISAAFAYAADVSSAENRTKAMGVVGAAFGLGFIGGPALGGLLAGPGHVIADFAPPALAAAALSAIALILALVILKRPPVVASAHEGRRTGLKAALSSRELAFPLLAIFVSTFAFAGMESTFSMWSERALGWGARENGFMFAFMGFVAAMVQGGGAHRLATRIGEWRTATIGAILLAVGMGMVAFTESLPVLVAPAIAMALGFGLMSPSLNSALSLVVKNTGMGAAMGAGRSAATLARAIGPVAAGFMFAAGGKAAPFLAGAVLLAALTLALMGRKTERA